jgi:capsular polysaccharide biosynthesis protein
MMTIYKTKEEEMYESDELEIDLKEIFYLLKEKIVVVIVSAVLCALIAGVISFFVITPTYQSTAKVYIITKSTSITSLADIQLGSSLTSDYMELIKSRPVVEKVIDNLNLDLTYEQLLAQLTAVNPADTRFLNITIEDKDPRMAKAIADDFVKVSQKRIAKIMKIDEPSVVEKGHIAKKPVSPNKKMNVLLGFLLGGFLSMMLVIVMHIMDDTVKTPEDIEKYLGINTLSVIPIKEGTSKKKHKSGKRRK